MSRECCDRIGCVIARARACLSLYLYIYVSICVCMCERVCVYVCARACARVRLHERACVCPCSCVVDKIWERQYGGGRLACACAAVVRRHSALIR